MRIRGPCLQPAAGKRQSALLGCVDPTPGTSDPRRSKAVVDTDTRCTLMPPRYKGSEPVGVSGVTGSQQLTVLEAEVSLAGDEQHEHSPVASGPAHPWHRAPQERVSQCPQRVLVGFW